MTHEEFFKLMYPYAQTASHKTTVEASVILSQWALESNYGNSDVAKNAKNYAGIKNAGWDDPYNSGVYSKYKYSVYPNIGYFEKAYSKFMLQPNYKLVRNATGYKNTAIALGQSPWAERPYNGGQDLLTIIKQYNLTQYDRGHAIIQPVSTPQPTKITGATSKSKWSLAFVIIFVAFLFNAEY
jgi:lysozyme